MRPKHGSLSLLIACGIAATACTLSDTLPSFPATLRAARAPAPPESLTAQLRALGRAPSGRTGRMERDRATEQTRVSLTTHRGAYFMWVQHPRVTFFYVFNGLQSLEHVPASVFLVFLTHEPQAPNGNRLTLKCNEAEQAQDAIPAFDFEPGPFVTNRVFTYELPLATFLDFARCNTAAVRVGDITVPFGGRQLADVRSFAGGMGAVEEGDGP